MRRILFMLVLALAWRTTSPGLAGTWYVDGYSSGSGDGKSPEAAFNTIQRGIDAAYHGDTIVVGQGTYFENIQFKGKNITVTSSDPLDSEVVANTIIDGSETGSVVVFQGSEDEQCVLSGFTVRNGRAKYGGGVCGGTADNHTRAVIRYNVINKNSAISSSGNEYCGGGMVYCDGLVERNTITGNRADYGGGLGWCNGLVQHNTISGNSVTRGGGLFHCDGRVRNNVLSNNSGTVSGGALCGCAGIIENNTIAANSAPAGGGLFGCNGTIRNNLITGNIASKGGGLNWCGGTIRNNTIVRNSAHREGGGITKCSGTIGNCIIWGNTAPDGAQVFSGGDPEYCCIESWMESGLGNTTEDPRFRYNSYFLTDESPCVDAGYNVDWMWEEVDLAGNPRILPRTSCWRVDMGAFEYVSPDLRPLMITRTGGGEVWVIRIGLPGERCIFRWTWDLINEPWQEKLNVSATSRLTIFKDLYPSGGQRFYQLEIR